MTATVLVVEDDADLRETLRDTLSLSGFDARYAADGEEALNALADDGIGLVISDVQMPSLDGLSLLKHIKANRPQLPVLLMTAYGTIQQAVSAMREGAADYLVKPFEAEVLVGRVASFLPDCGDAQKEMIAVDPTSRALVGIAEKVAKSDVTAMITGESGTGKEVLARYVHDRSARADGSFVAVNCAAIPDTMLESILFGYEKGAFTGAHKACPGKFEQANGGTLLLDEVSEMDIGLQAKLLRVLQEREVERLGGRGLIPLDVRVLATSNRDMKQAVAMGEFREDLYFRLNVFPLHLRPLRERPGDILPIAHRLIVMATKGSGSEPPTLSEQAERCLLAHRWPGNVRELDNVIQRALILMSGTSIEQCYLHFETDSTVEAAAGAAVPASADEATLGDGLKVREHDLILDALRVSKGSRKQASSKLGISSRTLRYKLARMREAGIQIPGHEA
jgi:two-component system response regulator FlrC